MFGFVFGHCSSAARATVLVQIRGEFRLFHSCYDDFNALPREASFAALVP